jgi:hypothetical protein
MSGYRVSASRSVPAELEHSFDVVLSEPLPPIFSRRYGPFGPVSEVRDQTGDQTGDPWGTVGQSRRIVLSDGGAVTEQLTRVERPTVFAYQLSEVKGPLKAFVSTIAGEWRFETAGTGTRITWTWVLEPASSVSRYALPVLARLWRGYARQALEEIEKILV